MRWLTLLLLFPFGFAQNAVVDQFSSGASEVQSLVPLLVSFLAALLIAALISAVAWVLIRSIRDG